MAEAALAEHPEKVVLVRNTPRFDPPSSDPFGLKPQLVLLTDSVYFGLWCESKFKEKIHLGNHDLDEWSKLDVCQAYGYPHVKGYDGAHMFGNAGKSILTRSILSITPIPSQLPSLNPHPTYNPLFNWETARIRQLFQWTCLVQFFLF